MGNSLKYWYCFDKVKTPVNRTIDNTLKSFTFMLLLNEISCSII